jgi:ATP-dependent exoDNAse (exonuclease V) beta subunit
MGAPHSASLLRRLWPALESAYANAFAQIDGQDQPTTDEVDERYAIPPLRRAAGDWQMPTLPELPPQWAADAKAAETGEQAVEFYWVGTAARHAGTIVHRWLQRFAIDTSCPDIEQLAALAPTTRQWARDLRVVEDDLHFVCERVQQALTGVSEDRRGGWILGGEGCAELGLTGLWNDAVVSIVIDRVRIDEQGNHWIIDYKTSMHEGGDLDEFLHHEAERYRSQLQKYSAIYAAYAEVPVKAALYFPLLQQFREVDLI